MFGCVVERAAADCVGMGTPGRPVQYSTPVFGALLWRGTVGVSMMTAAGGRRGDDHGLRRRRRARHRRRSRWRRRGRRRSQRYLLYRRRSSRRDGIVRRAFDDGRRRGRRLDDRRTRRLGREAPRARSFPRQRRHRRRLEGARALALFVNGGQASTLHVAKFAHRLARRGGRRGEVPVGLRRREARDVVERSDRRGRERQRRAGRRVGGGLGDRAALDDASVGADALLHDVVRALLLEVTLDALHLLWLDRAHVVSHVDHADGLEQADDLLGVEV